MSNGAAVAGIDWASMLHVACVLDVQGEVLDRFEFAHDAAAIRGMIRRLSRAKVVEVAIERGDGPVVEELMDAGLAVFVVPPRQIKALRTRYGSAGNKDDRFDAYVLADTLRTDGHRWRPLREDSDETKALRALCRSRKDLVEARVAVINQLRSNLELAFPGGIGLFAKPDSAITLAFLSRFPTASSAAWLSPKRLANWLQSVGYTGGVGAESLYNRMAGAAPGLVGAEGDARGQITSCLVAAVAIFNAQIVVIEAGIADIFARHPDQHIFASLPRYWDGPGGRPARRDRRLSGAVPDRRRARCPRGRLPLDVPVRQIRACGLPLVVQQEAPCCGHGLRRRQPAGDPWAADIYKRAIDRGCRHPHAIRILARAWLRIIWRCWQDGNAFDPALHRARFATPA